MKLVYVSPVPWASISQRPHFFVKTAIEFGVEEVLWIDPYPSRFPNLGDFVPGRHAPEPSGISPLDSVNVISPGFIIPVEPLPYIFALLNSRRLNNVYSAVESFLSGMPSTLVIGKPCSLAVELSKQHSWKHICYDAMDDFPSFYHGLSKQSMARFENEVVSQSDTVLCSSHALLDKFKNFHTPLLTLNACVDGLAIYPSRDSNDTLTFGYIGTIASWFDWGWVIDLAKMNSEAAIELIGPLKTVIPQGLPKNIHIKGAIPHYDIMSTIAKFDVAIIPFLINDITKYVDPVKYYEYSLARRPILSTAFGEMCWHHKYVVKDGLGVSYKVPNGTLFFPADHLHNVVPRWSDRFFSFFKRLI